VSVVQVSVVVEASPQKVWDVVSDPRNLPRWDRHISGVDGVPRSGLRDGSEYQTEVRFLGARAHATSRVIEIHPPQYAKVRVRGLLNATVETWVEPIDNGKSRLRHRVNYRFPGGPLGELAARAVKLLGASAIMNKGIQAQKRQAEAG
jgi:carbon monoxide dehydrogenase subunit G